MQPDSKSSQNNIKADMGFHLLEGKIKEWNKYVILYKQCDLGYKFE